MMLNQKNFPGLDGFVWWTGIVESRKDPEKLGRCQIRQYGWHTENKQLIPTEKLFWAQPIFATNVSNDTYTPKEGDAVFGFFMDGDSCQFPFFFGRFPDKPTKLYPPHIGFSDPGTTLAERPVVVSNRTMVDGEGVVYTNAGPTRYPNPLNEQTTSRLARNENLDKTPIPFIKSETVKNVQIAGGGSWSEIPCDYNTVYPYNDSRQTESGHFFDMDDTKKFERIQLIHRTGTSQEIRKSGTSTFKHCKHYYEIVHGTKRANIRGNLQSTTERWTQLKSKGRTYVDINADFDMAVAGVANFSAAVVNISASSSITLTAPAIILAGITYAGGYGVWAEGGPPGGTVGRKIPYINNPKAPIDENNRKDEKKKKTKQDKMKEWESKITAPTGGGKGARWVFYINGVQQTLITHHATSNMEVVEYLICLGATGTVIDTISGFTYNIPPGTPCKIDQYVPDDTTTEDQLNTEEDNFNFYDGSNYI